MPFAFKCHFSKGKPNTRIYLLKSHKQVKLKINAMFIKPILNYAATVWTPHSKCHINMLEAKLHTLLPQVVKEQVVYQL